MQRILPGTWIVVADGGGARFFHSEGQNEAFALKQVQLLQPEDLLNDGPAGHRPTESTQQSTDEATFAKQLAHRLNAAALKNEYEHLVLMADPQTLGQMRPQLHRETTRRIVGEVAKTFTNAPIEVIRDALLKA